MIVEQKVRLISITKPVAEELDGRSSEDLIGYIARVSNPNNQTKFDTASKLIRYCVKNSHWSILEHSFMTVEIQTSRAIAQQIIRHRSFCFQELSQRYSEVGEYVQYEARKQDTKNRQNSIELTGSEQGLNEWWADKQQEIWDHCSEIYQSALSQGVAREIARFVLPLNTATRIYMTGSCRSWCHYLDLRGAHGTQKDHTEIALAIKEIFKEQYPSVFEAMWGEV